MKVLNVLALAKLVYLLAHLSWLKIVCQLQLAPFRLHLLCLSKLFCHEHLILQLFSLDLLLPRHLLYSTLFSFLHLLLIGFDRFKVLLLYRSVHLASEGWHKVSIPFPRLSLILVRGLLLLERFKSILSELDLVHLDINTVKVKLKLVFHQVVLLSVSELLIQRDLLRMLNFVPKLLFPC